MKETVKTSRTAGFLEKIFRTLNANYFNAEIEEPIITIQSTPRAYGHVSVRKTWRQGETHKHELNLGAGTLDRPVENVVATVLHEMIHLYNIQNNIQDCSRGGSYHNKKFKLAAEMRDLHIEYSSRIGWSITSPTTELCDFIIMQGWCDIKMNRVEVAYISPGTSAGSGGVNTLPPIISPPKTSSTRKYICPCCGTSIRATKVVNIKCMDCDIQMITL